MKPKELLQEKLSPEFTVMDIINVNHKPHPYCITPKHLKHSIYLGAEQIQQMESTRGSMCGVPGCNLEFTKHISDKIAFLQLTDNLTQQQVQEKLQSVTDICKEHKIDGFTFVETTEHFKIATNYV